ncbi:MAG: hypothetical protein JXR58_05750 [Bacteroidales bacterium]|nr:hypothetical protein [Bacteroidales bacterium]
MRRILFLAVFFISTAILAQENKFNYQAVVRNTAGEIMPDQNVSFRINILQGNIAGPIVFQEEHTGITTNNFGLVQFQIGNGTNITGSIESLMWNDNDYFVQIELDENGGTNYQIMGTSQLVYVPLAVYSDKSGEAENVINENQQLSISGNELSINGTGGNSVILPSGESLPTGTNGSMLFNDGTEWTLSSLLYHDNNKIGIGTTTPSSILDIEFTFADGFGLYSKNTSTVDGSAAIGGESYGPTRGCLGVNGGSSFLGTGIDLTGKNLGVFGVSNTIGGYGVYGEGRTYGAFFNNMVSDKNVSIAGANAAIEVDGGAVFGTETNALKIMDIIEVTGTTDPIMDATIFPMPAGWNGENTRVLFLEIKYNNNVWYGGNMPAYGVNEEPGYFFESVNNEFWIQYPSEPEYLGKPYRVIFMKVE